MIMVSPSVTGGEIERGRDKGDDNDNDEQKIEHGSPSTIGAGRVNLAWRPLFCALQRVPVIWAKSHIGSILLTAAAYIKAI